MTWATLKSKILDYLEDSDFTDQSVDFFNMGIKKLERMHDFEHMRVRYEYSLADGDYVFDNPVPNYKKLISVHLYDSTGQRTEPLDRKTKEEALAIYPDLTDNKGMPTIISRVPKLETSLTPDAVPTDRFLLRPTCDDSYTAEIEAYQYSPDIDESTYTSNWWTENAWDVGLYAALVESVSFTGNKEMRGIWQEALAAAVLPLQDAERQEFFSGSMQAKAVYETGSSRYFDIDTLT